MCVEVLRKGAGTRASAEQKQQGQSRKGAQKQKNLTGQTAPPSPRLSLTAEIHSTASQISSWPAGMCEHGDRDRGSRRRPEPATGKNGKSCLSSWLPQRHIFPVCSFFSAEHPLCFSTGQVHTYARSGNTAVRRTPWRDVLSPVVVTRSSGRQYPGQLCMSTNWEHAKKACWVGRQERLSIHREGKAIKPEPYSDIHSKHLYYHYDRSGLWWTTPLMKVSWVGFAQYFTLHLLPGAQGGLVFMSKWTNGGMRCWMIWWVGG